MFITFEGLDFSGKSTHVKLLEREYLSKSISPIILREPGGTKISENIRDILLDNENEKMEMETELLLFSASRSQLVRETIIPSLDKGKIVISDRFHDSTTAYQGYGRGVDKEFINRLNKFVVGDAVPDITFFIDISVEHMMVRKNRMKNIQLDRIENSEIDFYERVRKGYNELCQQENRFVKLDANNSIEELHNEILSILKI